MELNNEFLSEVTDRVITNAKICPDDFEYFKYTYSIRDYYAKGYDRYITIVKSIYILTLRIKEWAYDNGYCIKSSYDGYAEIYCLISNMSPWDEKTEFEAVYKAGLWVFEKLKEQNND